MSANDITSDEESSSIMSEMFSLPPRRKELPPKKLPSKGPRTMSKLTGKKKQKTLLTTGKKSNKEKTLRKFSMPTINETEGSARPPKELLYKPFGSNKELWSCLMCVADEEKLKDLNVRSVGCLSKKKQTQQLAKAAYCTKCDMVITFTASNHKTAREHMLKHHPKDLEKKDKPKPTTNFFSTVNTNLGTISKVDQLRGECLTIRWLCKHLHPLTIVEDECFRDLIHYINSLKTRFKDFSRETARNRVKEYIKLVRAEMKKVLKEKTDYYSTTTDIWTSINGDSFMALTLHALTIDFYSINLTLDVEPMPERHTGKNIADRLEKRFEYWELEVPKLLLMLRDAASNGKKAMKELGWPSKDCITHGFHLVVGPLFFKKTTRKEKESNVSGDDSDDEDEKDEKDDDDIADHSLEDLEAIFDEFEPQYKAVLAKMTVKVENIRKIGKYIRKSPNAKRKFMEYQAIASPENPELMPLMDVRTRWSSTEVMTSRFVQLKQPVYEFLVFVKSPTGKKELNKKRLPEVTNSDWAYYDGIIIFLKPFSVGTRHLCGELHPTFVLVLPTLRSIENFLGNPGLFSATNPRKYMKDFYETHGDLDEFPNVVNDLDTLREGLYLTFMERFSATFTKYMWCTYLDPRFRNMDHLRADEKPKAMDDFIAHVAEIAKEKAHLVEEEVVCDEGDSDDDNDDDDEFNYCDKGCSQQSSSQASLAPDGELSDEQAEAEAIEAIRKYQTSKIPITKKENPLEWWRRYRTEYPLIAELARRWLCIPASSTPSERVFSDCGIAQAAKQNRLGSDMLTSQIIIRRNDKHVDISTEDLIEHFRKKE